MMSDLDHQSKPCCAQCGADASQFTWAPNSQHSMDGFLVYCKRGRVDLGATLFQPSLT